MGVYYDHMTNIIISFLSLFTNTAYAHVGYVIAENDFNSNLGNDTHYFLSPLSDSRNIFLILGTLVAVFVVYFLAYKITPIRSWIIALRSRLDTYMEFIPWILRLSLGIALIGASSAHVLISPLLHLGGFELLELVIGFMLLAGFLVVPSALAGMAVYAYALAHKFYLIGNIEMLFAFIALILLGSARPGADDLFGIAQVNFPKLKKFVPTILRLGIGGAMTFLAIYEKVLNPHVSVLVVEKFHLTSIIGVSPEMWVFAVGIIEIAVGLFLLIGFQTRLISVVAFLVLVTTFFFFKEDVYSHITLFGILSCLMISGAGPISVDSLFKRSRIRQ